MFINRKHLRYPNRRFFGWQLLTACCWPRPLLAATGGAALRVDGGVVDTFA